MLLLSLSLSLSLSLCWWRCYPTFLGLGVSCHWAVGAWRGISIFTFITFLRRKVNNKRWREKRGTHSAEYLHTWPMKHRLKAMLEIFSLIQILLNAWPAFKLLLSHSLVNKMNSVKELILVMMIWWPMCQLATNCSPLHIATPGEWRQGGFCDHQPSEHRPGRGLCQGALSWQPSVKHNTGHENPHKNWNTNMPGQDKNPPAYPP